MQNLPFAPTGKTLLINKDTNSQISNKTIHSNKAINSISLNSNKIFLFNWGHVILFFLWFSQCFNWKRGGRYGVLSVNLTTFNAKNATKKNLAKFCATYATFSSRDLFLIYARLFGIGIGTLYFMLTKIIEKKSICIKCIIQVLAHTNRYV